MANFLAVLEEAADRVTVALDALLPRSDGPETRVMEAMRYAALGPGKRIRPFLAIECGRLVNAEERGLLRCAAALECVHAYSLIHDDLPAMDDDDLRRGKPTVHKAFGEAAAILDELGLTPKGSAADMVDRIAEALREMAGRELVGTDVFVKNLEIGPPVGKPVQYRVTSSDMDEARDAARGLAAGSVPEDADAFGSFVTYSSAAGEIDTNALVRTDFVDTNDNSKDFTNTTTVTPQGSGRTTPTPDPSGSASAC